MKIIYFVFLLCCTFPLSAQYMVSGNLKNDQGEIVEFANMVLYEVAGDKLVKGVTTDVSGIFKIEKIKSGDFYLKAMMLGYADYQTEPFILDEKTPNQIFEVIIKWEAQMLESVEVVAKVLLLEQRADRIVVNVGKSLTNVNGRPTLKFLMRSKLKSVDGILVVVKMVL